MTEKRFMVDDCGTLIDMQTRDTFDYVSDVCDLLNDLNNENKTIKDTIKQAYNTERTQIGKTHLKTITGSDTMNKKPLYEIKGSLVIDRKNHRSYNLTSRIDAENLYSTLTQAHQTLQQVHETDQKYDKITKQLIQIQMSLRILDQEIQTLKEMVTE